MKEKTFKSKVIYALTGRPCENILQEAEMAQIAQEHEYWGNEKQEKPEEPLHKRWVICYN